MQAMDSTSTARGAWAQCSASARACGEVERIIRNSNTPDNVAAIASGKNGEAWRVPKEGVPRPLPSVDQRRKTVGDRIGERTSSSGRVPDRRPAPSATALEKGDRTVE
jgi:hypothetical protein